MGEIGNSMDGLLSGSLSEDESATQHDRIFAEIKANIQATMQGRLDAGREVLNRWRDMPALTPQAAELIKILDATLGRS